MPKGTTDKLYEFTLVTADGIMITWTHLTRKEATALHAVQARFNILRSSTELRKYTWKEMI